MGIRSTEQRRLLEEVASLLHKIGSANDAEDHLFLSKANQMRRDAGLALEKLLIEKPGLSFFLPGLRNELKTGHIFTSGWSKLLDRIESLLESGG